TGPAPALMPVENSVTTPAWVIRPIVFLVCSLNHMLPSGPRMIRAGSLLGVIPCVNSAVVEAKERARLAAAAEAARIRRRLGLTVAGVVGVCAFLLIGLAAGVDTAWTWVIGAGVLIGLIAGVDQLLARRSEPRS
ncbi:MAG: hypothetical protein ACRDSN_09060, partial [Pseudonocardiaceae bacterium]